MGMNREIYFMEDRFQANIMRNIHICTNGTGTKFRYGIETTPKKYDYTKENMIDEIEPTPKKYDYTKEI